MKDISSGHVQDKCLSLPKVWTSSRIGDTLKIVRGISFPKEVKQTDFNEGYLACLRTANIQKDVIWDDLWFVPSQYMRNDDQMIKINDILISTANSYNLVGKVALVKTLPYPSTLGAFISLIRAPSGLDSKYIYYHLASSDIQENFRSGASTTTNISNISNRIIEEIKLKIPPLQEQHRIVTKIEELLTQLDAGVASLKIVQAQLKRYRQAVLKAAFEGRLTQEWREQHKGEIEPANLLLERIKRKYDRNEKEIAKRLPLVEPELFQLPEGWSWVQAQDVCENITNGYTPTADKLFEGSGEIPFIKVYNLTKTGAFDFTVKPTFISRRTHETELKRSTVYPKDVLMSIVGPPMGKVSLVPEMYGVWNVNQAIVIYRTFPEYSRNLILYALLSETIQKWLKKRGKTTAGQTNYTITMSRSLPIPLPPLNEQSIIVDEIDRLFSIADELEKIIVTSLRQAESLRQSILKRAFEGKLVPQDPTDEPASVLLERIKAENAHHAIETQNCKKVRSKSAKRKIPND